MSGEYHVAVDPMTKTDTQETKRETGSTSQEISSHNINIEDDALRLDKELLDRLQKQENENYKRSEDDYKIGYFPQIMMQNCQDVHKYFTPKLFHIGPVFGYHEIQNEDLKDKLAAKFIKLSVYNTPESSLEKIKTNIQDLRECFVEDVISKYDDDTLARCLFLEGCAILEFIQSYLSNGLKELGIDDHQASMIREDLFLLNNQIPFRVLKLLMDMSHSDLILKFYTFIFLWLNNIMAPVKGSYKFPKTMDDIIKRMGQIQKIIDQNTNVHLLDLLHSLIVSEDNDVQDLPRAQQAMTPSDSTPSNSLDERFLNLDSERFFRNVQELKSAGIKFKPTTGLATVSFNSKCFNLKGYLKLPTLIVDKWTERKIMNLVAYEMCLSGNYKKNKYYVTSYIKFMDFLIDREEDVKELRASRVLWNRLSNDVEVAQLFNKLGSKCFDPQNDMYSNIRREIQIHCERKCAIWMAQVYQDHFSSPWTIVALLAAIVVISLTAVQAWFAVNPKKS